MWKNDFLTYNVKELRAPPVWRIHLKNNIFTGETAPHMWGIPLINSFIDIGTTPHMWGIQAFMKNEWARATPTYVGNTLITVSVFIVGPPHIYGENLK